MTVSKDRSPATQNQGFLGPLVTVTSLFSIPLLAGALADRMGIQHAPILPAVCYLYILYYALKGSEPRPQRAALAD